MDNQTIHFLNIIKTLHSEESWEGSDAVVDWKALSEIAKNQNLLPLFVGLAGNIEDYVNSPGYQKDQQDARYLMARQIQRSMAFLEVYGRFQEKNLEPIVLKGLVCRQLYGKWGEGRPSSDEDIFIEIKEYPIVKAVLEQEHYICEFPEITEQELRQIQAVSFFNPERRLTIEVHVNAIGKENPDRVRMNQYFCDAHRNGRTMTVYDTTIKVMDPNTSILFLILHAYKHFQGRGVGIRQILDALLYYAKYEQEISKQWLRTALSDCGAERFWNDICAIGYQYLGIPIEKPENTCCPEALLNDVMESGIFGGNERTDFIAARIPAAETVAGGKKEKLQVIFRAVFPSRRQILAGYPFLEKKPWLLPVVWIRRGFKFVRFTGKDLWKVSGEILQKNSERAEMIKKYKQK